MAAIETVLINDEFLIALLNDIDKASQTIDFETYMFNEDDAGRKVTEALCAAASRGVKVRVLVDGVGTPEWGGKVTAAMEPCGILAKVYHPLPWVFRHWRYDGHHPNSIVYKFMRLLSNINARNHRKICIIDHKIAYVGSANITNHLLQDIWRETSVKLTNIKLDNLLNVMEIAWRKSRILSRLRRSDYPSDDTTFRLNFIWQLRRKHYRDLLTQIADAKHRIWVTNSYFVPDHRLLKSLLQASQRGVDVKIILPKISDVYIESLAAKVFYDQLIRHGVQIFEYTTTILHAKSLIIDDWFLIGTSNLNYRSLRHDLEVDVNIKSQDAKDTLVKRFNIDLEDSVNIKSNDVHSSPIQQLLGRVILIFKYWI